MCMHIYSICLMHPTISHHPTPQDSSGSTAVIAVVTPTLLAVANLGDSRAVLLSSPSSPSPSVAASTEKEVVALLQATPLSFDHKPELPLERARVERAGASSEGEVMK